MRLEVMLKPFGKIMETFLTKEINKIQRHIFSASRNYGDEDRLKYCTSELYKLAFREKSEFSKKFPKRLLRKDKNRVRVNISINNSNSERILKGDTLYGVRDAGPTPTYGSVQKFLSPSYSPPEDTVTRFLAHFAYVIAFEIANRFDNEYIQEFGKNKIEEIDNLVRLLTREMYRLVLQYGGQLDEASVQTHSSVAIPHLKKTVNTIVEPWIEVPAIQSIAPYPDLFSLQVAAQAFFMGKKPDQGRSPDWTLVHNAASKRFAASMIGDEISRSSASKLFWVRGAVSSGKSTILIQSALEQVSVGQNCAICNGMDLDKFQPDDQTNKLEELLRKGTTCFYVDDFEFVSEEAAKSILKHLLHAGTSSRSLIIATQTERLKPWHYKILKSYLSRSDYQHPELRNPQRDVIQADRLEYEHSSDITNYCNKISDLGINPFLDFQTLLNRASKIFNNRINPLMISTSTEIFSGADLSYRVRTSFEELFRREDCYIPSVSFRQPNPLVLCLAIIAACRYRHVKSGKFHCDSNLIITAFELFYECSREEAKLAYSQVRLIIQDEFLLDIKTDKASAYTPRKFTRENSREFLPSSRLHEVAEVDRALDARHPSVVKTIYDLMYWTGDEEVQGQIDEYGLAILIRETCLEALSVRASGQFRFEYERMFCEFGRSFDSRKRDEYYLGMLQWLEEGLKDANFANIGFRFSNSAANAMLSSIIERDILGISEEDDTELYLKYSREFSEISRKYLRHFPNAVPNWAADSLVAIETRQEFATGNFADCVKFVDANLTEQMSRDHAITVLLIIRLLKRSATKHYSSYAQEKWLRSRSVLRNFLEKNGDDLTVVEYMARAIEELGDIGVLSFAPATLDENLISQAAWLYGKVFASGASTPQLCTRYVKLIWELHRYGDTEQLSVLEDLESVELKALSDYSDNIEVLRVLLDVKIWRFFILGVDDFVASGFYGSTNFPNRTSFRWILQKMQDVSKSKRNVSTWRNYDGAILDCMFLMLVCNRKLDVENDDLLRQIAHYYLSYYSSSESDFTDVNSHKNKAFNDPNFVLALHLMKSFDSSVFNLLKTKYPDLDYLTELHDPIDISVEETFSNISRGYANKSKFWREAFEL